MADLKPGEVRHVMGREGKVYTNIKPDVKHSTFYFCKFCVSALDIQAYAELASRMQSMPEKDRPQTFATLEAINAHVKAKHPGEALPK